MAKKIYPAFFVVSLLNRRWEAVAFDHIAKGDMAARNLGEIVDRALKPYGRLAIFSFAGSSPTLVKKIKRIMGKAASHPKMEMEAGMIIKGSERFT